MYVESANRRMLRYIGSACAAVIVRTPDGDQSIGSAFHVGNGIFLTARHVVDGNAVIEIIMRGGFLLEAELRAPRKPQGFINGATPFWNLYHGTLALQNPPLLHPDPEVDVALLTISGCDLDTPVVLLGGHYDDWIGPYDFLLDEAIVFGYPPIPMTKEPTLVVAACQVNAIVDTYRDRYVRFAISGPPRGGFSGGPAIIGEEYALGMVTESLENPSAPALGFFTVLSIEPLRECLEHHRVLPEIQKLT